MNLAPVKNDAAFLTATQSENKNVADKVKNTRDMAKVENAAKEFEAVFVAEMLKPMFEGISTDGMFGGGKGEEVFRGQLLQEYGKLMADTGSIGIASYVKDAMIKMQAEANGEATTEQQVTEATTPDNKEVIQ